MISEKQTSQQFDLSHKRSNQGSLGAFSKMSVIILPNKVWFVTGGNPQLLFSELIKTAN